MRATSRSTAEIAVEHGFFDQSHLVNELRALCGMTPAELFRRTVSGSPQLTLPAKQSGACLLCYARRVMSAIPASSRWIFWDVDPEAIELERDANGVLARVLERGCLDDVTWLIRTYGLERIHAFFRDVWAAEVSERTRGFWRAFFEAEDETWAAPPAFRSSSSSLWIA